MKIYWLSEPRLVISRPHVERAWITETDRAAYKCKPMRDASLIGWQILTPCDVVIRWTGGAGADAIHIECSEPEFQHCAVSHFKFGLVSFVINAILRTPPGIDTVVTGPINGGKPGIQPLSARIETDWLPFHFAMTWRMLEPDRRIIFEQGEPFAQFFEIQRSAEQIDDVENRSILENPELLGQYASFLASRQADALAYEQDPGPRRPLGHYDRGQYADGSAAVDARRRLIKSSGEC
jgi:Family of unknown function (DUF6065)